MAETREPPSVVVSSTKHLLKPSSRSPSSSRYSPPLLMNLNPDHKIPENRNNIHLDESRYPLVPTGFTLPQPRSVSLQHTSFISTSSTETYSNDDVDDDSDAPSGTRYVHSMLNAMNKMSNNATHSHLYDTDMELDEVEEESGTGWAPIVGGILSGVAVILLILIVLVMLWERRKRKIIDSQTYMDILTSTALKPSNDLNTGGIYEDHLPTKQDSMHGSPVSLHPCPKEGISNAAFHITDFDEDGLPEPRDDAVDLDKLGANIYSEMIDSTAGDNEYANSSAIIAGMTPRSITQQRIAMYQAAVQKSKDRGKKKPVLTMPYDHILPSIEEEEARSKGLLADGDMKKENSYGTTLPTDGRDEVNGKVVDNPIPQKRSEKITVNKTERQDTSLASQEFLDYIPPPAITTSPKPTMVSTKQTVSAVAATAKSESMKMAAKSKEKNNSNQDVTINIQLRMSNNHNEDPTPPRRKNRGQKSKTTNDKSGSTLTITAIDDDDADGDDDAHDDNKTYEVKTNEVSKMKSNVPSITYGICSPSNGTCASGSKGTGPGKHAPAIAPKPRPAQKPVIDKLPENTVMVDNEVYGVMKDSSNS